MNKNKKYINKKNKEIHKIKWNKIKAGLMEQAILDSIK